jgi:hypothetical protein
MKPPAPDVRYQAAAWAQTFREDWEECRNDPDYAAGKAWCLLAAWGDVCRLYEEPPAAIAQLPELLQRDAPALLTALRQAPEPAEWLDRARDLSSAWDGTVRTDHLRELEDIAVILFDELDRHSLAACMAGRLASDAATAEHLRTRQQQVEEAEAWFRDHVVAFLPAAKLAGAVFAACRPGLEEDEALWGTVLKHRLLEETAEELNAEPLLQQLTESDKQAILTKADRARSNGLPPIVPAQWRGQQILAFSRQALPKQLLAAATPADSEIPDLLPLRFRSAKKNVEVRLFVPTGDAPLAGSTVVRLNCYDLGSGKEARRLANNTVYLAGIERSLDERGRADFTLRELCEAGQDLFVVLDGEPATLEPTP